MNAIFKSVISRPLILLFGIGVLTQVACKKDEVQVAPPVVVADQSFSQNFENMSSLTTQGWVLKNLSDMAGNTPAQGWSIQPETSNGAKPYEGNGLFYDSYLAGTDLNGNISDWLISPKLFLQNGDKISFYTLSHGSVGYGSNGSYGDRLQLRLNTFNTSDSIGTKSTDVGHFTMPLLDINPLYKVTSPGDYPSVWTKYEATVTGLNQPDSGRFAIRYFVELNGGANGDELAIDKLQFTSAAH